VQKPPFKMGLRKKVTKKMGFVGPYKKGPIPPVNACRVAGDAHPRLDQLPNAACIPGFNRFRAIFETGPALFGRASDVTWDGPVQWQVAPPKEVGPSRHARRRAGG
jgi:hypothetical protein